MSESGGISPSTVPLGPGALATLVTADSGNQANAAATATLPAAVGKTTFITGFDVTASGATAGLAVTITITNLATTLHYTFVFPAGAAVSALPLSVRFPQPIPSSAVNQTIVVSLPASGAGGTNATVTAYGYQQ